MREGGGYILWSDPQILREADVFNLLNATWGVEACACLLSETHKT